VFPGRPAIPYVLPVRYGAADDGRCFAGSLFYFPLIGLGIGLPAA